MTGKVMGNQVCALGPQPSEASLLFLAGEKTRPAYVRGKPTRVSPLLEDDPETYQAE